MPVIFDVQSFGALHDPTTWNVLEPLIPPAQAGGRPCTVNIREVINAIFYILATGGAWRLMPHDLPPWSMVYYYFRWWRTAGCWQQFNQALL
jgi:putative transposase